MWSYLGSGLLVVISAAGLVLRVITLAGSLCCGCEQVTLLSQGLPLGTSQLLENHNIFIGGGKRVTL